MATHGDEDEDDNAGEDGNVYDDDLFLLLKDPHGMEYDLSIYGLTIGKQL